jgi:hypothetical protein
MQGKNKHFEYLISTADIRITDLLRMLRLLEDVPNMGGVKNMHVQYFSWKT